MERPEKLDNYLIVPLSAAYLAKQELLAAGIALYLADSELWYRIDFGDDILPKPYQNPYSSIGVISSDEVTTILHGFFETYPCYIHRSNGREEINLRGTVGIAFLRPEPEIVPSYLEYWHDFLKEKSNNARIIADIESERRREKQILETAQETGAVDGFSEIIMQVGEWLITEYGLECIPVYYNIEHEGFERIDWLEHMSAKTWVNYRDFVQALNYARQIHAYLKRTKNKQE